MSVQSVAVIGVGVMGAPMAMNIHGAGLKLTVCDRSETARAPFASLGLRCTDRPAGCTDCDVIVVLTATPDQMRDVIFGAGGVVEGLKDSKPMIAIMGTVAPKTMREFARDLAPHGVRIMDAPVSGGVVKARDGTLAVMMGGTQADCDTLRPVAEAVGEEIFHCGALGTGQVTKIVNNLVGISILMVAAEAYRIGIENGLLLPDAMPVFEAGTGRNFLTAAPHAATEAYSAWAETRSKFDALQSIISKDVDLALSIGTGSGPLPMTNALRTVLAGVGDETFETWSAVVSAAPGGEAEDHG
jgi:3-hydroxyisobutyrate dehydrogenase-like beta-hydroxyacid dehydrogenase